MPHVLWILTCFVGAVLAWGSVLALCVAVPRWRAVAYTGWRMLVGSTVGFVVANLTSIVVGGVPVLLGAALGIGPDHPAARVVLGFALLGFVLGPLVASPLGFLGGALVGLRRSRRAPHAHGR